MNFSIIGFIVSLSTLGLVIYLLLKLRDTNLQEDNKTSLMETKINDFSEDIKKIGQELISVTTPINEMNRFFFIDQHFKS